jgi:ABC-type antimicrobial peptide transport system permease subunit
MAYEIDYLVIVVLGVLIAFFVIAAALMGATNVLFRSVAIAKEIATRRVLGARRSQIVRMFLVENVSGLMLGLGMGAFLVWQLGTSSKAWLAFIFSAALLAGGALIGTYLAARHAASTPFSMSGLFCAGSDKRGEQRR